MVCETGARYPGEMLAAFALLVLADSAMTAPVPPREWASLRVGASSGDAEGHPSVCLEVSPLSFLSLEGCGTGSGFLHNSSQPELAHFRSKLALGTFQSDRAWFRPQLALGFAELQVAEDEPGFDFSGTGSNGVETAGPEVGASIKMLVPVNGGFEIVGDLGVGVAYMRHAPRLARDPAGPVIFSAGATLGFGF